MVVLYGNSDNRSNLEVVPVLKSVVLIQEKPLVVLDAKSDVFGRAIRSDEDEVLASLQGPVDPSHLKELENVVFLLVKGTLIVLERQLQPYLTGELSDPSEEMIQRSKSAPIHNIFSEQVLGMTDHQYHRALNATMDFIDGKGQTKIKRWTGCPRKIQMNKNALCIFL